ncbi:MAG: (d)CMP kinase [Rhodothermales bacterium]
MIIAIDGPAGSGKSSTAREVASRLGALFVDTGAMYRAMALKAIQVGVPPEDEAFGDVLSQTIIGLGPKDDQTVVFLDGEDVSDLIRTEEVSGMSSRVSKRSDVRLRMVELQRAATSQHIAGGGVVVIEGRDIGTVVFPEADYKFFVTAAPVIRAQRRARQLADKGEPVSVEELLEQILERDQRDETRPDSPLRVADDAVVVDTSDVQFEEQVDMILDLISGNAPGLEQ